jgi:DNA-binding beta-propeller fold protein YncE
MRKIKRTRIAIAVLILAFLISPGVVTIFTLEYDTSTKTVVMPSPSSSAAFDPSNEIIYVSSLYKDKVYAYNSSTLKLQSTISTNGMVGYQFGTGELYDPVNSLLYVAGLGVNMSGITVINTRNNSIARVIDFGENNFTESMVLGNAGRLFVSEGNYITEINCTHIVANYSTGTMYNDGILYAFNGASNTSYLDYDFQNELISANDLQHLNGSDVRYGHRFGYPTYLKFDQRGKELLLATSSELYAINPYNITEILFKINLGNTADGVFATMYSNSTGILYVATYGSQAIFLYNGTTGRYIGSMRQTDNYNTVTAIIQLNNQRMVASVGNRLILENVQPSNLTPNFAALEAALAVSACVVGPTSVIVFLWLRRSA